MARSVVLIRPLTDQQKKVLEFIETYASHNGFPPTLREIGAGIGIANVNAVRGHIMALEKKGYIAKAPDKARSIHVLRSPSRFSRLLRKLHEIAGTDKGVVHRLVYGLAWPTFRRQLILDGRAKQLIEDVLERECVERGWELLEKEIRPDYVRLIVQVWPNHSAEQVVRRFKRAGDSVRHRHPKCFPANALWDRGYAATTDLSILGELVEQMRKGPETT